MKKENLVDAWLVVIAGVLAVGCSSDPGDSARNEEGASTPATSDSVVTTAAGTGTWVFVTDRECRSDCVERGCSCTGPLCPGAPQAGLPCTFLGNRQCLVKGAGNLASVFYCESN
jgi:hypothetical protein